MPLLLRVTLVPERARYGLFRRDDFSPPITNWYQSERHRRRGSVEVVAVVDDVNGGNPRVERESCSVYWSSRTVQSHHRLSPLAPILLSPVLFRFPVCSLLVSLPERKKKTIFVLLHCHSLSEITVYHEHCWTYRNFLFFFTRYRTVIRTWSDSVFLHFFVDLYAFSTSFSVFVPKKETYTHICWGILQEFFEKTCNILLPKDEKEKKRQTYWLDRISILSRFLRFLLSPQLLIFSLRPRFHITVICWWDDDRREGRKRRRVQWARRRQKEERNIIQPSSDSVDREWRERFMFIVVCLSHLKLWKGR